MSTNTPSKRNPSSTRGDQAKDGDAGKSGRNGAAGNDWWKPAKGKAMPKKVSAKTVFGKSAIDGQAYRWGIAASTGSAVGEEFQLISRLACEQKIPKRYRSCDLAETIAWAKDPINQSGPIAPAEAVVAVGLAATIDQLFESQPQDAVVGLCEVLIDWHREALRGNAVTGWAELLLGIELGLTLAWRLPRHPESKKLRSEAIKAFSNWCDADDESIASAVEHAVHARLMLAALIRIEALIDKTTANKPPKSAAVLGETLATWVAAMTGSGGSTAMSRATPAQMADDLAEHGLLDRAIKFDPTALGPAMAAALGRAQTGGRLAWEVSLPESFWTDDDAKFAVMLPEWDVRRGRVHIDYSEPAFDLEMFAGRAKAIDGPVRIEIALDGVPQQACGPWEEICQFSDDDVHYLELEQPWIGGSSGGPSGSSTNDLVLQRQILLLRGDRCVLFADAVLMRGENSSAAPLIEYECHLPVGSSIEPQTDGETTEVLLCADDKKQSPRVLVLPLSAGEWVVGASGTKLVSTSSSDDGKASQLILKSKGTGGLYTPLWFDFERPRFKRKRTWRKLTVGDQLRLCRDDEASAFRIQAGSDQWAIYRDLGEPKCRTFLGKHMMTNFFVSRFDMSDGYHESLITVDDDES